MEAAMGGASFNIDRDWESICGILSFDQDSDFSNLLAHNPHHQLSTSDDNESLLDLLIEDTNPITSTFGQFHTHQTLPNPGSNTFPQLMSCSPTTTDDVSNNSSSSGSLHYLNDQDSCHFAQPYDNDDQFSAFIKGSSKANQFCSVQIQSHQIPLPKKRTRVSKEVGKGKRRTPPRKNKLKEAVGQETEEEDGKSSYEASDNDEESNDTQELEIQSLNGKKRASRGAATDPQSLYARKRRERINERLKILQTLVPNGTKVDISTMLEEAVNYVKFLQLQIKLLSSDEMWMYAPLAYNGFDVGHYNNFST